MLVEFPTAAEELADIREIEQGLTENPTTADRAVFYIERALQRVGSKKRAEIMALMTINQSLSIVRDHVAIFFAKATKEQKEQLRKQHYSNIQIGIDLALGRLDSGAHFSRHELIALATEAFGRNLPVNVMQMLQVTDPRDAIPLLKASLEKANGFIEGELAKIQRA